MNGLSHKRLKFFFKKKKDIIYSKLISCKSNSEKYFKINFIFLNIYINK